MRLPRKIKLCDRGALIRLAILSIVLIIVIFGGYLTMIAMPGKSYSGEIPPLTTQEILIRDALRRDVEKLAGEIGERNFIQYQKLVEAADFLATSFESAGYQVERQRYKIDDRFYDNIEVEIVGGKNADEIVVVGGHYDSVVGSPGANDNATGAAGVLALARIFAGKKPERTLRFVEFVNEEPPFFWTADMGSLVYAKRCRERNEKIVGMLSLETIGYYSDVKDSQKYPAPLNLLYPTSGNFIGFIGNTGSSKLVRDAIASFRRHTEFPSEGAAIPGMIPGVGWSDQWAFWQHGYQGLMVTDTAPYRYPFYHTSEDTPDKVNWERTAKVIAGLAKVVADLVGIDIN
ncbi:aminopeptidase [Oscillatoriales cyanobacterium USR001]|nr:aminopeptidase [Oscillatoriales cyanobacterium USR001]